MAKKHSIMARTGGIAFAASLLASPVMASPFTDLFIFGDSLVDAGNTQAAVLASTGGTVDPTPAEAGYFMGRFTNGPDYTDLLSQSLFGTLTTASLFGGDNFSFGGARARDNTLDATPDPDGGDPTPTGDTLPDLVAQVDAFIASGKAAGEGSLAVINVGGNDLFDLTFGNTNGLSAEDFTDEIIEAITSQVERLDEAGVGNILVAGIPDVGGVPIVLEAGLGDAGRANSLEVAPMLEDALAELDLDANLSTFDFIGLFDDVLANLEVFGLPADLDLTTPCLVGTGGGAPDVDCTSFAFFDGVHVTAPFHEIIFDEVSSILGLDAVDVPAPGAVGLMLFGLGGLVAARRRNAA
ncbi:MAG: SGNH/GDSL hydrolase family protein [Pseudomonadota bacterium]